MVSFMASDIHHEENVFYEELPNMYKMLEKFLEKEYIDEIFTENAQKIIQKKACLALNSKEKSVLQINKQML